MTTGAEEKIAEAKQKIADAAKLLRQLPDEWGWDRLDVDYQDNCLDASIILTKLERNL